MDGIIPWVAPIVGLLVVAPAVWRALPSARAAERAKGSVDRLRLLAEGAEIVAVLALVRFIGTWTSSSILGWYALLIAAGVAVAGLVLRAAEAPWIAGGGGPRRRMATTALLVAMSATLTVATFAL